MMRSIKQKQQQQQKRHHSKLQSKITQATASADSAGNLAADTLDTQPAVFQSNTPDTASDFGIAQSHQQQTLLPSLAPQQHLADSPHVGVDYYHDEAAQSVAISDITEDILPTIGLSTRISLIVDAGGGGGIRTDSYDDIDEIDDDIDMLSEEMMMNQSVKDERVEVKVARTSKRNSSQTVLDSLSINKLNMKRLGVYGRDQEIMALQSLWKGLPKVAETQAASAENTSSQACYQYKGLAVVAGVSGSGKTRLITRALQSLITKEGGLFVSCKFDMEQESLPFGGIAMLLTDLCDQIWKQNATVVAQFRDAFLQPEMQDEISFLTMAFPKLQQLIDDMNNCPNHRNSTNKSVSPSTHSARETKNDEQIDDDETKSGATATVSMEVGINPAAGELADDGSKQKMSTINYGDTSVADGKGRAERLKYCVKRLLQSIPRPMAFFFDDAHWADQDSLDLLMQYLEYANKSKESEGDGSTGRDERSSNDPSTNLSSNPKHRFLLVLSFRSNLVNQEHPIQVHVNRLSQTSKNPLPMEQISIGNLKVDDVQDILNDLLSRDDWPDETRALAEVLHNKTQGNAFFVSQLILQLEKQGLIAFSLGGLQWTWNTVEIEEKAPTADNVVELLRVKLDSDEQARAILPIVACLGSSFDQTVVELLVDELRNHPKREQWISPEESGGIFSPELLLGDPVLKLEHCERVQFLQRSNSNSHRFRFVHDRIQEACLSFLSSEQKTKEIKFQLGRILLAALPDYLRNTLVVVLVDLLENGLDADGTFVVKNQEISDEAFSILKLNLLAGQKAMRYSAYKRAARYFRRALSLLSVSAWETHRDVTLDLYSSVIEAEFCTGDFEAMHSYAEEVFDNAHELKAIDKFRATTVLIDGLMAQSKGKEAIDLAVRVLEEAGCRLPRGKLGVGLNTTIGLMKAKYSRRMKIPDLVASLPISEDPLHSGVMKILDHLATASFIAEPELFPVIVLKQADLTFQNGVTTHSPPAFALIALLLTNFLDDFDAGWGWGQNALAMLKRLSQCKEVESRTVFLVANYTSHWSLPLRDCLKQYLTAYRVGLSSGDPQFAMYAAWFYTECAFYTAAPLASVDEDMSMYSEQMKELGQENSLIAYQLIHQVVRSLRNWSSEYDPTETPLSGDIIDMEAVFKHIDEGGASLQQHKLSLYRYRIILCCYIGDYETGAKLGMEWADKCIKGIPGHPATEQIRFCSGMCCLIMAQSTGNKKWLREGRRIYKIVKNWSDRPRRHNPNCVHQEILLKAELSAAQGKTRSAFKKYEAGILMAGRRGLIHDQALANERYADLCVKERNLDEAMYRYNEALRLFSEWGANEKVDRLLKATAYLKE